MECEVTSVVRQFYLTNNLVYSDLLPLICLFKQHNIKINYRPRSRREFLSSATASSLRRFLARSMIATTPCRSRALREGHGACRGRGREQFREYEK